MATSKNTVKVVSALVAGALTGASLGVLFAPQKGSKIRGKIAKGAKDLKDKLGKKVKDEVSSLRHKAGEMETLTEKKAQNLTNKSKQKADSFKHQNTSQEIKTE